MVASLGFQGVSNIQVLSHNCYMRQGSTTDSQTRAAKEDYSNNWEKGLQRIEKSVLPGKLKTWIYHYGLLSRLVRSLMVNSI